MARLVKDGYGQLELNQVAWPRDGRIEAQCALDASVFSTGPNDTENKVVCQNGMILVVDNVARKIRLPGADDDETTVYAINYSSEHLYDERAQGLKNFKLYAQPETAVKTGVGNAGAIWPGYDFFPRLGYLSVGDKFTTNTVELNGYTEDTLKADLKSFKKILGGVSVTGDITLIGEDGAVPNGPVLQVIKVTTMPDGQPALKFQVVKA